MLAKFYSLEDFAHEVGETVGELAEKRRQGKLFPPDTVFCKKPYWFRETIDQYISVRHDAICQAWGYPAGGDR